MKSRECFSNQKQPKDSQIFKIITLILFLILNRILKVNRNKLVLNKVIIRSRKISKRRKIYGESRWPTIIIAHGRVLKNVRRR